MKILSAFAVEYYIFGKIKRVEEYAEVEIYLARMKDEQLEIMRSEKDKLMSDDKDKLAQIITKLTNKLLLIDKNERKSD